MQRASWASPPASSRRSMAGGAAPSEADLDRLRRRLHQSGALVSSRSVVSRPDAQFDFDVVDVGPGRQATPIEHLLARLEQHGLRRRLLAEDDAASYAVDNMASLDEEAHPESDLEAEDSTTVAASPATSAAASSDADTAASHSVDEHQNDTREAHYYLCVPCELRLTRISHHPPTRRDLENAHFHVSSAAHRAAASWMADDDIDETLHCTPLVAPTHYYARIFLNGVPTLLSRRPGGGDMFYPLPHELGHLAPPTPPGDRAAMGTDNLRRQRRHSRAPSHSSLEGHGDPAHRLFPPSSLRGAQGGLPALWHGALPSVYTQRVQRMRRTAAESDDNAPETALTYRLRRSVARVMVSVEHISVEDYRANTLLPLDMVPLLPAVYRLRQERVPKPLLARLPRPVDRVHGPRFPNAERSMRAAAGQDVPHRTVHTQPYRPIAHGPGDATRQMGDGAAAAPAPLIVFEDECYRVALVSATEARQHFADASQRSTLMPVSSRGNSLRSVDGATGDARSASQPVLTLELLKQHTQSSSQGWQRAAGDGSASAVGSSYFATSVLRSRGLQRTRSGRGSGRGSASGSTTSALSPTSGSTSTSSSQDSLPLPRKRVKQEC